MTCIPLFAGTALRNDREMGAAFLDLRTCLCQHMSKESRERALRLMRLEYQKYGWQCMTYDWELKTSDSCTVEEGGSMDSGVCVVGGQDDTAVNVGGGTAVHGVLGRNPKKIKRRRGEGNIGSIQEMLNMQDFPEYSDDDTGFGARRRKKLR